MFDCITLKLHENIIIGKESMLCDNINDKYNDNETQLSSMYFCFGGQAFQAFTNIFHIIKSSLN